MGLPWRAKILWVMKLPEKLILRIHNYISSQGNGMEGISKTISFCTQFTYQFFCSPHTWNNETCLVEFGESKWNWRSKVWKILTFISLIVTLTQILMEFGYILFWQEDLTPIILFRRVQILGCSSCLIMLLNTVWKPKEFKEFINQFLQLFRLVEHDCILPLATFNRIFWVTRILMIFTHLMLLYIPLVFAIFVVYSEVDPNVFSKLLPGVFTRTSVPGRREHWNPFVAFAVGATEFSVVSHLAYNVLSYASFISIGAIAMVELLQEMKNVIARSQESMSSALLDTEYFVKLYKALYLLCNRLNDWIASVVIPGALLIGMAIIISINYTLLTTETNEFAKLSLMAGDLQIATFFGLCMQMASFFSFYSKESLRAMAVRRAVSESKYNSRRLRGCMDCRVYFGNMLYFTQTTILKLGHIVVDNTIQAVITFR